MHVHEYTQVYNKLPANGVTIQVSGGPLAPGDSPATVIRVDPDGAPARDYYIHLDEEFATAHGVIREIAHGDHSHFEYATVGSEFPAYGGDELSLESSFLPKLVYNTLEQWGYTVRQAAPDLIDTAFPTLGVTYDELWIEGYSLAVDGPIIWYAVEDKMPAALSVTDPTSNLVNFTVDGEDGYRLGVNHVYENRYLCGWAKRDGWNLIDALDRAGRYYIGIHTVDRPPVVEQGPTFNPGQIDAEPGPDRQVIRTYNWSDKENEHGKTMREAWEGWSIATDD